MRCGFRQVVDGDQNRDLRVVHRRYADEGGRVAVLGIEHLAVTVVFGQNLGGRSLAADAVAGHIRVLAGAVCDNLLHRLAHVSGGILGNDLTDHLGLVRRLDRTVSAQHFLDNIRLFQLAVVHDRADHVQHLNRRYREALTERCGRQCDFVPVTGNIQLVELALALTRQVDAGRLGQAERPCKSCKTDPCRCSGQSASSLRCRNSSGLRSASACRGRLCLHT